MRYLVIAATLILGCGSADKAPVDLSVAAPEYADLAVAIDLTAGIDAAVSDFAFSPCTSPKSGIYYESVQYSYVLTTGGPAMSASSSSTVVVKNDGSFVRPSSVYVSPDRYHCSFITVDPALCTAPCCPGQVSSPVMYFDSGGWTIWSAGACAFQTATGAMFIANITDVEGYFAR